MQTDEEEDGILINGAQGHQPDPDEEFGTPPTRGASGRLAAGRTSSRGGSVKYRQNASVPGAAKAAKSAKQTALDRKRAERHRTRTVDRAAARAYKVLDPMLLDVLGIDEGAKEGAAGTGLATGLSSPASGVPLHGSSSQADIARAGTPSHQTSVGSRPGSALQPRPSRRTPADIPSPSSGRSSPALSLAAHSAHTLGAARAATRPADNGALPARPMPHAAASSAWAAAATSAAPARPPSAPPAPAPLRQRGHAWSSTGGDTGAPTRATLEPVLQEPPQIFALPPQRPGLGVTVGLGSVHRRQPSGGRRISALSGSISTGLGGILRDQIEQERVDWSASIHDALSRQDDAYDPMEEAHRALEDAREEADTLKNHLIILSTTQHGWTELDNQIKLLEDARSTASTIMKKLNTHRTYLSQSDVSSVQSEYSGHLVAVADVISDAVAEGLEKLASTLKSEDDVRGPMRISVRAIQACASVARELREGAGAADPGTPSLALQSEGDQDMCASLETCAVRIVEASLKACSELAHDVLQPSSLTPPVGHALAQRERSLRAMWRGATELLAKCVKHWERQALHLNQSLGEIYSEAARLALTMIADTMSSRLGHLHLHLLGSDTDHSFNSVLSVLRQLDKYCAPKDSTGDNISSSMVSSSVAPESVNSAASGLGWSAVVASGGGAAPQQQSGGMGANQSPWGNTAGKALPTGTVVSDEELLAHSWVPRLLMELHGRACGIHKRLKDLLASVAGSALLGAPSLTPTGMAHRRSANGGSGSLGGQWSASGALLASPDVQRTYDLMDEMQERFASLVLNNFQRTAWLCNAVVVPAMWALEVLKDQAENALRLGKAYDGGTLGMEDVLQDALSGLRELDELAEADAALGMDGEEPEERAALRVEYQTRLTGLSALLSLLRSSSQEVVRVFLHLRRQLKIRRPDRDQDDMGLPARLPQIPVLGCAPTSQTGGAGSSRQAGSASRSAAGHSGEGGDAQARQAPVATQQADSRGAGTQPHSAPETARGTPRSGGGQITSPFAALTNNTDWPAISNSIPPSTSHRQPAAQPVSNGTASQHGSPADPSTPRSQAAVTRHPSCDPSAGAFWYGEQPAAAGTSTAAAAAAAAAPALGTEQQPITLLPPAPPVQPVSSWRAVVAATTLSGQQLLNAAANRAHPTFTFPPQPLPNSPEQPAIPARPAEPTTDPSTQPRVGGTPPRRPLDTLGERPGVQGGGELGVHAIEEVDNESDEDAAAWVQPRRGRRRQGPVPSSAVLQTQQGSGTGAAAFSSGRQSSNAARGGRGGGQSRRRPFPSPAPGSAANGPIRPSTADSQGRQGVRPQPGSTTPRSYTSTNPFAGGGPGNPAGSLSSAGSSPGRAGEGQALMASRARPPVAPTSTQTGTQQGANRGSNRPMSPFFQAVQNLNSADFFSKPGSRVNPAHSQASNAAQVTSAAVVTTRPSQQQPAARGTQGGQAARQPAGSAAQSAAQASRAPAPPQPDDAFWQIPFSALQNALIEPLGNGSFGSVWRGKYHNGEVAVKIINVQRGPQADEEALARFRQEVNYQRQLSYHPNIVRFIGACCEYTRSQDHGMLAIVMEMAMLGSLFKMREMARKVGRQMRRPGARVMEVRQENPNAFAFWSSWETRFQVASGAAAGVQFMHFHNVVHRDLTSNNLVLDRAVSGSQGTHKWVAKVCDFNLSRTLPSAQQQLTNSGRLYSPLWAAPELLTGRDFGKAADVYSFGIILWEILTLEIPYATEITTKPGEELGRDRMDRLIFSLPARVPEGLRPILPAKAKELNGPPLLPDPEAAEQLYQGIKKLIERCWSATPSDRPTMEEVANVLSSALTTIEESHALRVAQAQAARRATAAAPAPAAAAAPVQG